MICLYIKSRLFWHCLSNIRLPRFDLCWFLFGRGSERLFQFFVARKGIPSCVLFRGMVRNGIPGVCFSTPVTHLIQKWRKILLPQKGSEQNYGRLLLFLSHGTEFRVVFSSAEGFGTEFRDFLFRGTTGIPSEITFCSVYSVFRGIIFLPEIPNPKGDKDWPLCQ